MTRRYPRVQTVNDGPEITVQSQADQADIHHILGRYKQLGIMDQLRAAELQFADVSEFTDLKDALNQAKEAEKQFMKLPPKVRELFNHDVAEWLDTAHDQDKQNALKPDFIRLGLIPDEAPTVVEKGASGGSQSLPSDD